MTWTKNPSSDGTSWNCEWALIGIISFENGSIRTISSMWHTSQIKFAKKPFLNFFYWTQVWKWTVKHIVFNFCDTVKNILNVYYSLAIDNTFSKKIPKSTHEFKNLALFRLVKVYTHKKKTYIIVKSINSSLRSESNNTFE
jgi:hypothetical protein